MHGWLSLCMAKLRLHGCFIVHDDLLSLGLFLCPVWLEEPLGLVLASLAG